ncbi:MAG: 3-deoxy-D-manno-octulosonic acid transferase [Pseudomonadota bacterium]|nr:3-deoxy-D-manno-octulosonic acid transferase [Pseudomonadota bacterium]
MRHSLKASAARAAYSLLLRVSFPLYLLRVLWRGRSEPVYATSLRQRIGWYGANDAPAPMRPIWIHAVSLGETLAAAPLIEALRKGLPRRPLLLTHGTATGRAAGQPLLRPGDAQAWLPFDTPGAARRFLGRFDPLIGILMETEIWPNVLASAARRGLPMLLANARMSERSRRRGRRVDALLRPAFASLTATLAQSAADAERLRDAGAAPVRVEGNIKFDLSADAGLIERGRRWRGAAAGRPVLLAAITREGEEALLLSAWRALPAPRPLLVVVPRHPQRFDAVADLIEAAGFSLSRRSRWGDSRGTAKTAGRPADMADMADAAARSAEVWLGDSMREMPAYYGLADVALLGGSFAPLGGQNLIEAAACGCPIVMGPHTYNFAEAADLALAAGAAVRVASMPEGVAAAIALALSAEERRRRADAGLAFAAAHRGAAARTATYIAALLERSGRV